jgi:ubiquinone/menaquinone biosynthesis C-methylase UbiE
MDHADHVALIRGGMDGAGPRWLELGAGTGAFTLALLDLIGEEADIVALDRDASALRNLEQATASRFPTRYVRTIVGDFTRPMPVEAASFDGVLMANSLHFVRDKMPVLLAAIDTLRPGGRLLIVEYESDRGNPWVPWPIGYASWEKLAAQAGLRDTRRSGEVPSRFLGSMYAAVSRWDGQGDPGSGDGPPTRPGR